MAQYESDRRKCLLVLSRCNSISRVHKKKMTTRGLRLSRKLLLDLMGNIWSCFSLQKIKVEKVLDMTYSILGMASWIIVHAGLFLLTQISLIEMASPIVRASCGEVWRYGEGHWHSSWNCSPFQRAKNAWKWHHNRTGHHNYIFFFFGHHVW